MARASKIPQCMCVCCREMKKKKELIMIVRTPDVTILVDPTGKKSVRGAYICPNVECFNLAVKGKRIAKALEREIPDEIIAALKKDLVID